jgi:alkylhydroperoxidase family enzyme
MARIHLPTVAEMSAGQKEQYDRFPANLTRALVTTTACAPSFLTMGVAFRVGQLGEKDRELVILRVAALSGSAYERMQHLPIARGVGWSDDDIARIERGAGFDARSDTLLRFVDECVDRVKVTDATFAAARAFLSEGEIAEMVILIGHYMMTARFLETLEVDLDVAATPWDNMKVG